MLIITRRVGQCFFINGDITVKILGNHDRTVRLGIEAPANISVLREELSIGKSELQKEPKPSIGG